MLKRRMDGSSNEWRPPSQACPHVSRTIGSEFRPRRPLTCHFELLNLYLTLKPVNFVKETGQVRLHGSMAWLKLLYLTVCIQCIACIKCKALPRTKPYRSEGLDPRGDILLRSTDRYKLGVRLREILMKPSLQSV